MKTWADRKAALIASNPQLFEAKHIQLRPSELLLQVEIAYQMGREDFAESIRGTTGSDVPEFFDQIFGNPRRGP
jgi:hypothetical protein